MSGTFTEEDVDNNFNHNNHTKNPWLTKGIKISCQRKRDLYKYTHDLNLKNYYKNYTKILAEVIKTAKKIHYNKLFIRSKNKVKTVWNLVRAETNKQDNNNEPPLNMEGEPVTGFLELANIFNNYFVNATHSIKK